LLIKCKDQQASSDSKVLGKDVAKSLRLPAERQRAATSDLRVDLPLRTKGVEASASQYNQHYQQPTSDINRPPLPPRRQGAAARDPSGLMDEDDGGASSILLLQPMGRTDTENIGD